MPTTHLNPYPLRKKKLSTKRTARPTPTPAPFPARHAPTQPPQPTGSCSGGPRPLPYPEHMLSKKNSEQDRANHLRFSIAMMRNPPWPHPPECPPECPSLYTGCVEHMWLLGPRGNAQSLNSETNSKYFYLPVWLLGKIVVVVRVPQMCVNTHPLSTHLWSFYDWTPCGRLPSDLLPSWPCDTTPLGLQNNA